MRRRSSLATSPVPVVLPLVEARLDSAGGLSVTVDREPYVIPANVVPNGRPALTRILDEGLDAVFEGAGADAIDDLLVRAMKDKGVAPDGAGGSRTAKPALSRPRPPSAAR